MISPGGTRIYKLGPIIEAVEVLDHRNSSAFDSKDEIVDLQRISMATDQSSLFLQFKCHLIDLLPRLSGPLVVDDLQCHLPSFP